MARFVAIVIALHAPSWLVAWMLKAPLTDEHPLFNLDLLAAAALTCVSPLAGSGALFVAWSSDFMRAAARNYHFMSVLDFVDAARFIDMLNLRTFVSPSLLAFVFGFAGCAWIVIHQARNSNRLALALLIAAVMAAGLDAANGSFQIFGLNKDSRIINVNFAGSPIWNVWTVEQQRRVTRRPSTMPNPSSFLALRNWQISHPGHSTMLVLVESMGLPRNATLRAWLHERLATSRLSTRWRIRQSDEVFSGATVSGELRTLCGLQGSYSGLDDTLTAGCLPRMLEKQGVTSIGLHGFGLRMFDRNEWWPRIGLSPWRWGEDGTSNTMNCNQAFPGVCDNTVLAQAVKQVQQPGRFIYALTLDTHLPLNLRNAPPLPDDLQADCAKSATAIEPCHLIRKFGDLLMELERLLATSTETPFVIIVGDHAPPFTESPNRASFDSNRVLMFELEPNVAPNN